MRSLANCAYFTVAEQRAARTAGGGDGRCSIVICTAGRGRLATADGQVSLEPMRTHLVPAAAGRWTAAADDGELLLLVAQPVLG